MTETIEARELSGVHVGRTAQIAIPGDPRTASLAKAPLAGEIEAVSHDGRFVHISFRGLGPYSRPDQISQLPSQFRLDASDLVVVDPFGVDAGTR